MNSGTGLESATKVGQGYSNLGVGARERSGGRRSDTKGLYNGRGGKEMRKHGQETRCPIHTWTVAVLTGVTRSNSGVSSVCAMTRTEAGKFSGIAECSSLPCIVSVRAARDRSSSRH